VTKVDWGTKRVCPKCVARFYDLGKNPAACPKCGTEHDVTVVPKPRRGRGKAAVVYSNVESTAGKEKAKIAAKAKIQKPVKEIEGIDLEEFEDIETLDTEEEIEELEEIEDIETLDELEKVEEGKPGDDEAVIEDEASGVLIDEVDETEDSEAADEDSKRDTKVNKNNKK